MLLCPSCSRALHSRHSYNCCMHACLQLADVEAQYLAAEHCQNGSVFRVRSARGLGIHVPGSYPCL